MYIRVCLRAYLYTYKRERWEIATGTDAQVYNSSVHVHAHESAPACAIAKLCASVCVCVCTPISAHICTSAYQVDRNIVRCTGVDPHTCQVGQLQRHRAPEACQEGRQPPHSALGIAGAAVHRHICIIRQSVALSAVQLAAVAYTHSAFDTRPAAEMKNLMWRLAHSNPCLRFELQTWRRSAFPPAARDREKRERRSESGATQNRERESERETHAVHSRTCCSPCPG